MVVPETDLPLEGPDLVWQSSYEELFCEVP
jgi:hypothetical protein